MWVNPEPDVQRQGLTGCLLAIAIAALAGCGGGDGTSVLGGVVASFMPPPPSEVARDVFNVYDADKRRRAINLLSNADFGGEPPYLRAYRLLVDDPDPTVRAACLRALGQHGTPDDVARITPYLSDPNSPDFVHWEAAVALQRLHHPTAVDPLIRTLHDSEVGPEVRQACANALAQYPQRRVFQALVGALSDESYGMVSEAARSLATLTGRDFGDSGARWLGWAERTDDLFADRQPYFYPQYHKPPGLVDRMRFWDPPQPPQPQRPRGVEVAAEDAPPPPAALPPPVSPSSDEVSSSDRPPRTELSDASPAGLKDQAAAAPGGYEQSVAERAAARIAAGVSDQAGRAETSGNSQQ